MTDKERQEINEKIAEKLFGLKKYKYSEDLMIDEKYEYIDGIEWKTNYCSNARKVQKKLLELGWQIFFTPTPFGVNCDIFKTVNDEITHLSTSGETDDEALCRCAVQITNNERRNANV